MSQASTHNVLQLHGGGNLVLPSLLKCVVFEKTTGKRIKNLFDTRIADSGGAIMSLCLEQMEAADLIKTFIGISGSTFPGRRFFYMQPLSREPRRFDNSALQNQLKAILQDMTLADFHGNLFVGAHQNHDGAVTFEKFTLSDDKVYFRNAGPDTPLASIATMTSTIPGVYSESYDQLDPEHADGTFLDSIVNQNPAAILHQIQKHHPKSQIFFLQMGNIQEKGVANSLLKHSVVASRMLNLHWKYIVHQLHSAHINDAARIIGYDNTRSLISYGKGRYSPSDSSLEQLTAVVIDTLNDIEKRQEEYTDIARRLNKDAPLAMDVPQAIAELKAILDPMLKKRTVIISRDETAPVEFPSPIVVRAETSPHYETAYSLGRLTTAFAPHICRYLVAANFSVGGAFRLACESGLRKLTHSPQRKIEP